VQARGEAVPERIVLEHKRRGGGESIGSLGKINRISRWRDLGVAEKAPALVPGDLLMSE
jgi:hypothetical protein